MRKTIVPLFLLLTFASFGQKRAKGLIENDNKYATLARQPRTLNFATVPMYYSLKKYCPTPGNQGNMGSCVGWATGYAAFTMANSINKNLSQTSEIDNATLSALYIYNQIKSSGNCTEGSVITDAMDLIKSKGDCKKAEFSPATCDVQPTQQHHSLASQLKIKDYLTLFEIDDSPERKIDATINSIVSNKPVVIGMILKPSFDKVSSTGEYKPSADEPNDGGHAMCVVGFDNARKVFEIINSWGTSWGNKGFLTISYDDYAKYTKYGYQFSLYENPSPNNTTVNLSGDFEFKKFTGFNNNEYAFAEVKPILQTNLYTLPSGTCKKDDFYRVIAKNVKKDSYLYIFSLKPDNTVEILFPQGQSFSANKLDGAEIRDLPLIPSNNVSVEIPTEKSKAISTTQTGNDYLCILYSDKAISDIQTLVKKVEQSSGDFVTRLQSGFGSRLIPFSKLQYNSAFMSVKATSTEGYIAPLILKVEVK